MANEPLLELSTLRPKTLSITIDGKPYNLEDITSMSIEQQSEILRGAGAVQELADKGRDIDPSEAERMLGMVVETVGLMVDAPLEVIKKLSLFQYIQIIQVFTDRAEVAILPRKEQPGSQSPSTGAKSSQPCNVSTAEKPPGG